MIGDPELRHFRLGYYAVLVAVLWREPGAATVAALARGVGERAAAAAALHPALGEGWAAIAEYLGAAPAADVADRVAEEYTRLFIGPPSPGVNLYESYYLTGRVLDRPLADLRGFLGALGIARDDAYAEPEDFVAFELEVMRRLVERQGAARDPDAEARVVEDQIAFLTRHLLVWVPAAAGDLVRASGAGFYRGVGRLLEGFLDLERDMVSSRAREPIQSVDDARRRYAGSGLWKGPILDVPGIAG